MAKRQKAAFWRKGFFVVAAVAVLGGIAFAGAQFGHKPIIAADTPNGETKRVIVQFKNVAAVTSRSNVAAQQAAIAKADAKVQDATPYSEGYKLKVRSYDNLPYAAYVVDEAGEASLKSDPSVVSVRDDNVIAPEMNQVLSTLGGTVSGFTDASGTYDGSGVAVAVLDTGALTSHIMLSGKVKAEGCFSESGVYSNATLTSLCAGGVASATGVGASSASCGVVDDACDHGTHVSSIAAGAPVSGEIEGSPVNLAGIASGADIVSIQVFTQVDSATVCPIGENPCLRTFDSLVASGVDYIINLINNNTIGKPIVAANMSLGGGAYDNQATCTASAPIYAQAVSSLRSHNVAPIISNGNSGDVPGNENKIGAPACVNGAIAIGSTNKAGNTIASYSQNGALTTLLAPGGDYDGDISSVVIAAGTSSNSAMAGMQGTSMAAPVVAGTFAVLREKHPNATVDQLVALLQNSGVNVTETRSGYTQVTKKRVALANALTQSPYAAINTFTGPSGTINQGAAITLSGTVSNATSCSLNNGVGSVTLTGNSFTKSVPGAASYVLTCKNVYNDTVTRTLNFTVNAAPTQPTVESSNFDAAAGTFVINWGASTDTDGVEEYQIFLNGQLVDTVDSTVLSYTIQNLDPNGSYNVEVRAVDSLGAISTAASVTFGHISGGDDDKQEGVPNTGVAGIVTNSGAKLALFAGLSVAIIAGIVFAVRRNTSR